MTIKTGPYTYRYNATKDIEIFIGRKRAGINLMRLIGVSWTVNPEILEDQFAGGDRQITTDWSVSGNLETGSFNKMPHLDEMFYGSNLYYDIDRDILYLDNDLQITIRRWQGGVGGPEASHYDETLLTKIILPSFGENLRFGTASNTNMAFTARWRPIQNYAQQAEMNRSGS